MRPWAHIWLLVLTASVGLLALVSVCRAEGFGLAAGVQAAMPATELRSPTITLATQPAGGAWDWDLECEVGPIVGLFPDAGVDIGARIGFGLLTWPSDWLIVGGHRQFASILLCNGHPALGLDIGVTTAANDNKVRLGASVWNEGGSHYGWTMYLAGGVVKF